MTARQPNGTRTLPPNSPPPEAQPRHEADRVLMEFGHDPWLIEGFLQLTPLARLRSAQRLYNFAAAVWRRNGTRPYDGP